MDTALNVIKKIRHNLKQNSAKIQANKWFHFNVFWNYYYCRHRTNQAKFNIFYLLLTNEKTGNKTV
jgi:hypothetical protein